MGIAPASGEQSLWAQLVPNSLLIGENLSKRSLILSVINVKTAGVCINGKVSPSVKLIILIMCTYNYILQITINSVPALIKCENSQSNQELSSSCTMSSIMLVVLRL